ncbi:MAG: zinc-binding dehydrogenase [Planctomycetota bacterium]
MRALVRYGTGEEEVRIEETPEPVCGPGEVKIRVRAAGVCGTDLHGHPSLSPPVILGHEIAGEIVEVGKDVKRRKVGERVTSETTAEICGECRFCKTENYNVCRRRKGIATKAPGGFAEYFAIREGSVHALPNGIGYDEGALTEPLACAVHAAAEQGGVRKGELVAVVGPGPLGLLVTQVAKAKGARVILAGTAADAQRLALGRKLGADRIVFVEKEKVEELARSMSDGYGADLAIECSGTAGGVKGALASVRTMGRYVQGGILHRTVELDLDEIFFGREITMYGSHTQKPSSWREALQLLGEGKIDLGALITDRMRLSEWKEAFRRMLAKEAIKVILHPEG